MVLLMAAALATASCGQSVTPSGEASGDWRQVRGVPLSPRENAVGVWTGEEVLLFGGSDARPCPPNASCLPPKEPPLADGAAYRPATGQWRKLPKAPVGFDFAEHALIGRTLYVWVTELRGQPRGSAAFMAYQIEQDRWQELPLPPDHARGGYNIVSAAGRIIFYRGNDERGDHPDQVYDPRLRSWSELPADPLSPSSGRTMVWTGDRLVLFDHELTSDVSGDRPDLARAAVLDLASGAWRRLPDSELLGTWPWVPVGGRLVNPTLGGEDGGKVNGWGRSYPYGGILDLGTGRWSALPNPPAEDAEDAGVGLLTPSDGHFFAERGWVLDTATDRWIRIPEINEPNGYVQGRTVVSAGRDLFLFGGARFAGTEADLLNEAWTWSPPG
ncbi:MAG TPA: hypothetical protein VFZ32_14060 [Micromonosporaceae bacterium]